MTACATSKAYSDETVNPERLLTLFGVHELRSLAFIGLSKNAGKTTTLNHLLRALKATDFPRDVALSSIGRDGEDEDVVSGGVKPKIYVREGSWIATAESCLANCDAVLDLQLSTDINTAFGRVYIARALTDGYVEIAGPSIASELKMLERLIRERAADALFLVDGALSRRSPAGGGLTEAAILAVACQDSSRPERLLARCRHALNVLRLSLPDEATLGSFLEARERFPLARAIRLGQDGKAEPLETESLLGQQELLREFVREDTRSLLLLGAVTDPILAALRAIPLRHPLQLLLEDGSRLFVSEKEALRCQQQRLSFAALSEIKIPCLCINPQMQDGSPVDAKPLLELLRRELDLPVLNLGPALD